MVWIASSFLLAMTQSDNKTVRINKINNKNYNKMKKLALTIAIVLGLGMASFAGPGEGGMLGRGENTEQGGNRDGVFNNGPKLPNHGQSGNQNAPLGTGVMVLTALGAAYLVGKKREEE